MADGGQMAATIVGDLLIKIGLHSIPLFATMPFCLRPYIIKVTGY